MGLIYLIQENGTLLEMTNQEYDSEALLQKLLADYPNLLAGEQMNSSEPRKWLLIKREANVPSEESGAGRWSVDHLFIDQDGIPTIVEVKRSSDTRIRREVVGQMLDYAANAVVYWSIAKLKNDFTDRCQKEGLNPEDKLSEFLNYEEQKVSDFWQTVESNLRNGKIRMVFVADIIPPELQRIVEFLNEQMKPAEVLAVEIKQYVNNSQKVLVPRVIGQTTEAVLAKRSSGLKKYWNEETFVEAIKETLGDDTSQTASALLKWLIQKTDKWFHDTGTFVSVVKDGSKRLCTLCSIKVTGDIIISFADFSDKPPFDQEIKRKAFLQKLNSLEGLNLPQEAINRKPTIKIALLNGEHHLKQFFEVLEWVINEVKTSNIVS